MTTAGKVFVLINVGLSLFWAVAAFALYATSIDWGYDPTKPAGTAGGIIAEKKKEIESQQPLQFPIEKSWRDAREELSRREKLMREDRNFYAAQFEHNRSKARLLPGEFARVAILRTPLAAAPDKDDVAVVEKDLPKMEDAKDRSGKEMQSQAAYRDQLDKARKDNAALLSDLDAEIKKDVALTNRMLDRPPLKGLRTLLVDERFKREGVVEEQRLVEPQLVNTEVESALILKRLEGLQERIGELERYMKKRKMDVALTKR